MPSAAPPVPCPDCGAPVKTADKQCWMCFRALQWNGGELQAAAATTSPFADRPPSPPPVYYRTNPWAVAGIVLAAVAMVPAAFIAFCVTCVAAFVGAEGQGEAAGLAILPASFGAALVVVVGFGVLIGMLARRISSPFPR